MTDAATAMGKTVANTGTRAVEVAYDTAAAVGDAAAAVGDAVGETGARIWLGWRMIRLLRYIMRLLRWVMRWVSQKGGQIESNKKVKNLDFIYIKK